MKNLKIFVLLGLVISVSCGPLNDLQNGKSDDLSTSGSSDVVAAEPRPPSSKGDLKTSDSFGLGYYLPVVTPAIVKYHYPLYYYPYLHSLRHHGYGGYGFYHHGHGVIH